MRKLVLFGLVICLLAPGCSGDSDNTDAGDGDAGSSSDGDAGDCQFDPGVTWHIIGEILQMESADAGTCVWLKRTDLCPVGMICKSNPFSLDEVRIGHGGQMREFDSSNATLTWTPSWHNWEDVGTIDTGTTVYTLTAQDYGWAYNLVASGGETWGPILLEPWEP